MTSINKISKLIDSSQEQKIDEVRNYIGASSIGDECYRKIWYSFNGMGAQDVSAKTRRTLAIGKTLEGLIINWIKDAGVRIEYVNFTLNSKDVPIFQGHIDSLIFFGKESSVLEIKTAKDSSFQTVTKKGVKIWSNQYYSQVQSYMGMLEINSAYLLVLNKDNSNIYDEKVIFDPVFYSGLEEKAKMISEAIIPPPRINGSPLFYKCKMCKFNKVCHG